MRYRERAPFTKIPYLDSGFTYDYDIMLDFQSIRDVNNGKKGLRPESPCLSMRAKVAPILVDTNRVGFQYYSSPHARDFCLFSKQYCGEKMGDHYDRCTRKMKRLIDKQVGDFSSLNFLYELRELPALFKKIRRPQDFRFIDWQFAIAPTISDIKNALSSYDNAVASLNDKLKKFRSIECNFTTSATLFQDSDNMTYGGSGNAQSQTATYRVTTRMRGDIVMDVPILSRANPQIFAILDSLSVDISAGNAWNALPWSWFVDWFLPVGDFLESLPSAMKPQPRFVGTISHEINGFGEFITQNSWPSYTFPSGQLSSKMKVSIYERFAFDSPLSSMVRWRLDAISNPSQVAVLRDIMFPASKGRNVLEPGRNNRKR